MERQLKQIIDVETTNLLSKVLIDLINDFPQKPEDVAFNKLGDTGIAMFGLSGVAIQTEQENIFGEITQECLYPFNLVYRISPRTEEQKMRVKEFLDLVGEWLEKQPITIGAETYQINEYPYLSESKKIESITRQNTAHLNSVYQDGVEDWTISLQLQYENKFYR